MQITKTQAMMIQELLVANAINAQRTADVVDLMVKCQEIIDHQKHEDSEEQDAEK